MRQKRTPAARRARWDPDDGEPVTGSEDLAHWLLRMETGWGMPHDIVAIAASFVIVVRAFPSVADRMALRMRRWLG